MNANALNIVARQSADADEMLMILDMLGYYPHDRRMDLNLVIPVFHRGENETAQAYKRDNPEPPRTQRVYQPCGTPAKYRRHLRAGETPCDACRIAYNTDKHERNRKVAS